MRPLHGLPLVLAAIVAAGVHDTVAQVAATTMPWDAPLPAFWIHPTDLPQRDLFDGPWGAAHAPDPTVTYTRVRSTGDEDDRDVVIGDPRGRTWHVTSAHSVRVDDAMLAVVLSRVLSAVGYHQPPIYFLPSFTIRDESGTHASPGGRFRLDEDSMTPLGEWSWQRNPFVGMRPYQGLVAILMLFDRADLENRRNTLYDVAADGRHRLWYVVRDLGAARQDSDRFARGPFITAVTRGEFVVFDFHGVHQELVRDRITADDVGWTSYLLSGLTDHQWRDACRAGGYGTTDAARLIDALRARIEHGRQIGGDDWPGA